MRSTKRIAGSTKRIVRPNKWIVRSAKWIVRFTRWIVGSARCSLGRVKECVGGGLSRLEPFRHFGVAFVFGRREQQL